MPIDQDIIIQVQENDEPIIVQISDSLAPVQAVNGKIGWVILDKNDIGLSNVENISILGASGYLQSQINQLDTGYASQTEFDILSGNLIITGFNLNTQLNSLSGSVDLLNTNTVFITGDQSISGLKTFFVRPNVNGSGILLIGEIPTLPEGIVYTTGQQFISGEKTFLIQPGHSFAIDNLAQTSTNGWLYIDESLLSIGYNNNGFNIDNDGIEMVGQVTFDNQVTFQNISRPTVNGSGILLVGEAYPSNNPSGFITSENVVFTTGNQIINGVKSFSNDTVFKDNLLYISQSSGQISGSGYTGYYDGGQFLGRVKLSQNNTKLLNVGEKWFPKESDRVWQSVAISSDGKYQSAVVNGGQIYISNDYGHTWNPKQSNRGWLDIAISSDGKYQSAVYQVGPSNSAGQIFISNDYGNTWVAKQSAYWANIAMSSNGKYQSAVDVNSIWISDDYGNTWTNKEDNKLWIGISMSSDGKYQTATVINGQIYTSNDYGYTWAAKDSNRDWRNISVSSDGKYQSAIVLDGRIYISSDYGNTWTPKESNRAWGDIAISSDGKYQSAVVFDGGNFTNDNKIYISSDYGNTWSEKESLKNWISIAISSDGKYQTALDSGGKIYISIADELIDGNFIADNFYGNNLVYNTGEQIISGAKNFVLRPTVNETVVILSGEAYPSNNPSGFITGVDLSSYATITNLAATGATLQTNINTIASNLATTGTTLSTNLATTGSTLQANINTVASNLYATGSSLQTQIDNLDLNYATDASVSGVATDLATTGLILNTKIDNLSGYSNNTFATITNLAATGSSLQTQINNLATTGSTLNTRINSLSGYINSPSSNIVFTTGDQTINGEKTFRNLKIGPSPFILDQTVDINYYNNNWRLVSNNTNSSEIIDSALVRGSGLPGGAADYWVWRFNAYDHGVLQLNNPDAYVNEFGQPLGAFNSFDISVLGSSGDQYFYLDSQSGVMRLTRRPTVNGTGVLLSGEAATPQNLATTGSTLQTNINTVASNLAATGAANLARINSLSGTLTSTYATIANLATTGSTLATNLAATGSNLQAQINNLDSVYATDASVTAVANNLATTGSTLQTNINMVASNLATTGATLSTNLAATGSTLQTNINTVASNLATTGAANLARINSLSGTLTSTYATIANLATTGSTLATNLAATGSNLQAQINNLDSVYATDASVTAVANNLATTGSTLQTNINTVASNLATTGSTLNTRINSLSGTLTSTYATITNLATTGSTLNTRINNLSGYINSTSSNIVFTTGNQTINGIKTFEVVRFEEYNGNGINLIPSDYQASSETLTIADDTQDVIAAFDADTISFNKPTYHNHRPTVSINNGPFIGVVLSGETFPENNNTNYNYFTTNITLGNSYINLANSTSGITATLPSIASGRNYIVKNLNTGTLTVTGSNSIDGNVNLKLYKNESAHLLGVNNVGFTGWVSLNTNPGIS